LSLDPAAAGAHFASLNRFARLSEQAGLTPEQRQRLLHETRQGEVSGNLRREIEAAIRRQQGQATGLKVDDVVGSAQALPETLQGPVAVRLPGGATADRSHSGPLGSHSGPPSRQQTAEGLRSRRQLAISHQPSTDGRQPSAEKVGRLRGEDSAKADAGGVL
jgi:hypothetical protein